VRLYTEERQSCTQIAAKFGVNHKTILYRLKKANTPRLGVRFLGPRPVTEASRRKRSQAMKGKAVPHLSTPMALANLSAALRETHKHRTFGWEVNTPRIRAQGGTDAELYLASLLTKAEMAGWRREYMVMIRGRRHFSLDFGWPEAKLDVELDGNTHVRWAKHDIERDALLRERGWRVLRVSNRQLFFEPDKVIEDIRRVVEG